MSARKQIGSTVVINTIDEPVSVLAQYAPNDNPTSGQIHTTFQTGDKYMRTKSTEEGATWSAWQKIVGENGQETNYTFNISSDKTSASATTAPSHCYYGTWQDAPVVSTQAYPYLWMKVVKREWSDTLQDYVDGTPSYVRVTGEESTDYYIEGALNSIKLRAGENSTAVSCVYTFYQKSAVSSQSTTVACYYAVYLRSGTTFSLLTMSSGYTNHGNGTSVDVRANVPYKNGNTIYDAVVIYTFASSYYSTNPEGQSYMAKKEIVISKDGDNSFMVDLDNEMTGIVVDKDGKTKAAVSITPQVRAYYGATDVIGDCTVTTSSSDANVSATYNTTTHKVTVSANSGVTLSDKTTITITVTHSTYAPAPNGRPVTFILSAVKEGAKGDSAVLQELSPSLSEISFARLANKSLDPASRSLSLLIKKTDGSTPTDQTIAQSGLTIKWSTESMPATSSGGTAWGSNPTTPIAGITWDNTQTIMQVANSVAVSNIYIAAFNSSGTLVDRETIPVIKDGQHGDDGDGAPAANASPSKISVPCNPDGSVKAQMLVPVTFSLKVGSHSGTVTSVVCDDNPQGVTIEAVSTAVKNIRIPTTQTASGIATGVTFTVNGTYDTKSYSAQVTVELSGSVQGVAGDDSYTADLTNEMDSVPCTSDGITTTEQTLTTTVNFFKGTESLKPYTSIVCSVEGVTLSTDYVDEASPRSTFKASANTTTGVVTIGVKGGKALAKENVDIAVTADGKTRNLTFTINGVKAGRNGLDGADGIDGDDGEDAIIYSLLPSVNEIVKFKDNTYAPAANTYITCAVKKRVGNNAITDAPASEYTLKYILNETGGEQTYSATAIKASDVTKNVVFKLYDKATTPNELDRETIVLVKDGYDAPVATISTSTFTIQCDSSGNVETQQILSVTLGLKVGSNSATVTGVSYTTPPTGVSIQSLYTNAFKITIGTSATASGMRNGITFTVTGKYPSNGNTYTAEVTLSLIGSIKGAQGERGKTGRFFYYAGVFNASDNSTTFEVNDAQAPFFKTGTNYHVFNYSVNGSYTMAQMWNLTEESGDPPAKSFNNYPWQSMTSDFKYLITEAIFSDYAHLGSAIINGDFMMSQLGYVRGFNGVKQDVADDDTYYTNFNSLQPFGTEDLYEYSAALSSQWFIYNMSEWTITATSYTQLYNYAFNLKSGLWYTIEIDGYCDDGGSLEFKLAVNANDTPVAYGSISGYTNDNTFFPAYVTFKATSNMNNCKIFVRKNKGYAAIKGLYLRKAQFVPHFVVDLRSGEMSADKLNGKLRAKYFDYGVEKSLNTQNIVVGDNSVACLTNQASCAVILPNPAQAEGRIIEVFSASPDWTVMWEGAGVSDNFKLATNSTNGYYRTWWRADGSDSLGTDISYLKLWSDGTVWWVLNKIIIDNNLINN